MKKLLTVCGLVGIAYGIYSHLQPTVTVHTFTEPIDAISVSLASPDSAVRMRHKYENTWSEWYTVTPDTEDYQWQTESSLQIFDTGVHQVQVAYESGETYELHPITLDHEQQPAIEVAANEAIGTPKILSRRQWGADDSILLSSNAPSADANWSEGEHSKKAEECIQKQKTYAAEFATSKTVEKNTNGSYFKWPKQYSKKISNIVVHHTAANNQNSKRLGHETMQLLYAYHAKSLGWGDIGYNFVIDSSGQIYEGRDGGMYVAGGHAYCNNIGTIGVALMGHFNEEEPTAAQVKSLQWLLIKLTDDYGLNASGKTTFHGMNIPTIVGHRDVNPTACPGDVLYSGMNQIRSNVSKGIFSQKVIFPVAPQKKNTTVDAASLAKQKNTTPIVAAIGSTTITGRPGSSVNISLFIKAGPAAVNKRQSIAKVKRSNTTIGLWQKNDNGEEMRVRENLLISQFIKPNDIITERFRLEIPRENGTYTLQIGTVTYTINADGKKTPSTLEKGGANILPTSQSTAVPTVAASLLPSRTTKQTSSKKTIATSTTTGMGPTIRIKLTTTAQAFTIQSEGGTGYIGNTPFENARFVNEQNTCTVYAQGRKVGNGIVRATGKSSIKIAELHATLNRFRGTIECRVIDGNLVLINELPMEEYLYGLSEQPDSQPYEKQRTFAIAARSYAAHYLDPKNRKFAGKPYDGSDSPAEFQKYSGLYYEEKNPRWVQAVKSTHLQVITKNNTVVKVPYFSSDTGRTLTPAEAGWKNFPFAEVFSSKPDPWCKGLTQQGHGVGMSGCGAKGQALEGKKAEEILQYYYPTTTITAIDR